MNAGTARPAAPRSRAWIAVFAVSLCVYTASACPVVYWGDSAELSRRALTLELLPTARGYPLHRLLAFAAGRLAGDAGYGANLVSAFFGAVTLALVFEVARRLGRSTSAGVAAACVTGFAHTFWASAGVAEVYTLHTAFLAGAMLLAVLADAGGRRERLALGVLLGLSLLHHRLIAFAVPGLVLWMWTGAPAGRRFRVAADVLLGAVAGAIPFVVLCLVASRTPPDGTASRVWWWFQDVFLGGERNAGFILGTGRKGLAASGLYLAKWAAFNLPGPALVLAAAGLAAGGRRIALFLGAEVAAHLWFPLSYDWTGDQYSFLVPLYPILAVAAGVAVGRLEERRGKGAARGAALLCAAAPLVLYGAAAFTGLGERMLPGLTPAAARATVLPVHAGDRTSRDWCAAQLTRLPEGARLHCDWGDGQVYLYLQHAEALRRDVKADVWIGAPRLGEGGGREWVSVLPFTREPPRSLAGLSGRLEAAGDGLFRVLPAGPR